jgi:metal-sulfur cluster biosynthetic enzyme
MIKVKDIIEILKEVKDPEIKVDIVSLGLIYNIYISDKIEIDMSLTSIFCPYADTLLNEVENKLKEKFEIETGVNLVISPEWTPRMIDEETRFALDIDLSEIPNE